MILMGEMWDTLTGQYILLGDMVTVNLLALFWDVHTTGSW